MASFPAQPLSSENDLEEQFTQHISQSILHLTQHVLATFLQPLRPPLFTPPPPTTPHTKFVPQLTAYRLMQASTARTYPHTSGPAFLLPNRPPHSTQAPPAPTPAPLPPPSKLPQPSSCSPSVIL